MFSIPGVNVIQSDEGFSIEALGRAGMKHQEGQSSFFVNSEVLVPGKGILIITKSITQWDPPAMENQSPRQKNLPSLRI
jgi:hypothetical protein